MYNLKKVESLATFILAIVAIVSIVFSGLTYKFSVDDSKKINRPYLEVSEPIFELSKYNGEKIDFDQMVSSDEIKFLKLIFKITRYGVIPAEIIKENIEAPKINFYYSTITPVIIYDFIESYTNTIPLEQNINSWFEKIGDSFTTKMVIKYRMIGGGKIYEAYNESECKILKVKNITNLKCFLISSRTN